MYKLRPYQEAAVAAALKYIKGKSKKTPLIVAPTGAGKTLLIAETIRQSGLKTLILQPRKELGEQNYQKFLDYGGEASVCFASLGSFEISDITFAGVKTIANRLDEAKKIGFDLCLIDEAHLGSKKNSMVDSLLQELNIPKIIGFTATPLELKTTLSGSYLAMQNRSRDNIFNDIIHVTQISELVENDYWSKMFYKEFDLDNSVLRANSNGSDYTQKSQKAFYKKNKLNEKIVELVDTVKEYRKSILIFVPTIAEAEQLSSLIPDAKAVHSKSKDRDEIVESFRNLTLQVCISVDVLSYGFDHPELDCIISARATKSFAIYYQQLGRGVRIHSNKANTLVLDLSGNVKSFSKIESVEFRKVKNKWGMYSGQQELTYQNEYNKPADMSKFKKIDENGRLTFGKFKGKLLTEVESWYLDFILKNFEYKSNNIPLINAIRNL